MKWQNAKNVFFDDGSFQLSNISLFLTTTATTYVGEVTSPFYKQIHRLKSKFRNVQKKFDFREVQFEDNKETIQYGRQEMPSIDFKMVILTIIVYLQKKVSFMDDVIALKANVQMSN